MEESLGNDIREKSKALKGIEDSFTESGTFQEMIKCNQGKEDIWNWEQSQKVYIGLDQIGVTFLRVLAK